MGTSRVFVFIRRRTVSGARSVRFVCYEYCQNGCQNEIWNGSLKAVTRISNNHLVYEYHDGYIYHNSLAVSWYIASPMQTTSWLCCNALPKIDIGTLSANDTKPNRTKPEAWKRETKNDKRDQCAWTKFARRRKISTERFNGNVLFIFDNFISTCINTHRSSEQQQRERERCYCIFSLHFVNSNANIRFQVSS